MPSLPRDDRPVTAARTRLRLLRSTDMLFKMYCTARRHYGQGGTARIKHTLPPLIVAALALARRIRVMEIDEATPFGGTVSSKKVRVRCDQRDAMKGERTVHRLRMSCARCGLPLTAAKAQRGPRRT